MKPGMYLIQGRGVPEGDGMPTDGLDCYFFRRVEADGMVTRYILPVDEFWGLK
jgi:hypothetical protein